MPILEELRVHYDRLTGAQRQIAAWIVGNVDKVALMTIEEIATAVGVSPSSVIRFAGELGYSGFSAMQTKFREYLTAKLSPVERVANAPVPAGTVVQSFRDAMGAESQLLATTVQSIAPKVVEQAINLLSQADHIYVLGRRTAHGPAYLMAHILDQILGNTKLLGPHDSWVPEQLAGLSTGDVLVAIAFPRYVRSTVWAAKYAQSQGAGLIAITDSPISPLGRLTNCVFPCAFRGNLFQNSMVSAVGVINSLVAALLGHLSEEKKEQVNKRLKRAEQMADQMNLMTVESQ